MTINYYISLVEQSAFGFILCVGMSIIFTVIIIYVAAKYKLLDKPNDRKLHKKPTPTLGGLAIILSTIISIFLIIDTSEIISNWAIFSGLIILVSIGIYDDLIEVSAFLRLIMQLFIGSILFIGNIRFNHIPGIDIELFIGVQYILTVAFVIIMINAINLIDGIDGLAGGLSLISTLLIGFILLILNKPTLGFIAFSISGALIGFLIFNLNPAKIFMGDTGSTVIGFLLAVFLIAILQSEINSKSNELFIKIAIASVIVPIYDAFRVIILRILNKKSPLSADKTHIHHLLLNIGFNHKRSTIILWTSSLFLIITALLINNISLLLTLIILITEAIFLVESLNIKRLINILIKKEIHRKKINELEQDNLLVVRHFKKLT